MHMQTLISKSTMQTFYITIRLRLPWAYIMPVYPITSAPVTDRMARKLTAIITEDR